MTAASAGADEILKNAKVFSDTASAVADLHATYATTARSRDMVKEVVVPRVAIADFAARAAQGEKTGLMFGPERTGLINEDLVCAQKIIHIPANPAFSSFNLAQSVLILAYEWLTAAHPATDSQTPYHKTRPATREEMFGLLTRFEEALDERGFFSTEAMKPSMVQNFRNALMRAELSEQEVRTWHGLLTALISDRTKRTNHG
jgi:tRNA/rRNA methyltransferase